MKALIADSVTQSGSTLRSVNRFISGQSANLKIAISLAKWLCISVDQLMDPNFVIVGKGVMA